MFLYSDTITDSNSQAVQGVSVRVVDQNGAAVTIYSDDGVTATTNPVTTDANGAFSFYVANGTYDLEISKSGYGSKTINNLVISAGSFTELADSTSTGVGDALVAFKQSNSSGALTGAVARTVHAKLQEIVSVKDFGATGDGTTDDTSAIQAALDSGAMRVYFPSGTYKITSTINMASGQVLEGASPGNSGVSASTITASTGIAFITLPNNATKCSVRCLRLVGTNPYTAGSVGIDIGDHTSGKTMTDLDFENLYLYRLDIGIKADGDGSQISQVTVKQCQSIESNKFVYINGQDVDGWSIDTCSGSFKAAFLYCDKAGYIRMVNCAAYGYDTGAAMVYLNNGSREQLFLDSCQCESTDYFLRQTVGTLGKVTMHHCTIDSTVQFDADGILVLNGCTITAPVKLADPSGGNGYLLDINNYWVNSTYPTAVPTLASNSQFSAEIGTRYESDQNTAAKVTINRGAINQTLFPTYGTTITVEPNRGDFQNIVVTNGTGFTISNPTLRGSAWPSYAYTGGAELTIRIKNTSGGAVGTITWDTKYKMAAWTSPATGYSRSIVFKFDGTNWIEISRSAADVPN